MKYRRLLMRNEKYIVKEIATDKSAIELFEVFKHMPYSVILDSSLNTSSLGEYSIIVFDPFLTFKSKGNNIEVATGSIKEKFQHDPFQYLRILLDRYKLWHNADIPFVSGCVGYFSYDLCNMLEKLTDKATDDIALHDIVLGFYNKAIAIDHKRNKVFLTASSAGVPDTQDLDTALEQRLDQMISTIYEHKKYINENTAITERNSTSNRSLISNFTKESYCNMVEEAREYIRNGDIYQVNLSQRFKTQITRGPLDIYKSLRSYSPAPFSAYMSFDDIKVLSNSPERFIKINGRNIETRPIKGTRPRGKNSDEDINLQSELLNSEKDRAELTMIVDLERNDLGKVCKIGTVEVEQLLKLEKYATVLHLVSEVKGTLKDDVDVIDCIRGAFPGGSITGAPKVRAMEIIDELEPIKRGVYTGSIGYIDFNGNSDLNIAIRTIIIKDSEAFFNVGGGIVWDSVPEKEYQETLDKGKALIKVLEEGV